MKLNVINFHFIDYCNYKCRYCFVKKQNRMLSFDKVKTCIDNIDDYFRSNMIKGRINLVGGEIFLCKYLQEIIDYIYYKGIDVSLVTNGSLLTEEFILNNKTKLHMIGISVDSLIEQTNLKIGRSCGNIVQSKFDLYNLCKLIKENNIKLKINHCISRLNVNESIYSFIEDIKPDRFKVFQMTIVEGINEESKVLQLRKEEFLDACKKYYKLNPVIELDDEIKNSYLMIDSKCDFYVDSSKEPVGNLLKDSFKELIQIIKFDMNAFDKRYK